MSSSSRRWALGVGRWTWTLSVLLLLVPLIGCRQDMHDQPRYEALEASTFFADGMASRPLVEGTVARGHLREDDLLETGRDASGELATEYPAAIDEALLQRGQERYEIYCSVCHGRLGEGDGMVVRRGFKAPLSFHREDLRQRPPGYVVEVITEGFGQMPSYRGKLSPEDRWAIAAYVEVLQLSQHVEIATLPPEDRKAIRGAAARPLPAAIEPGATESEGTHP